MQSPPPRRQDIKRGLDGKEARLRRMERAIELKRRQRDVALAKRRQDTAQATTVSSAQSIPPGQGDIPRLAQQLACEAARGDRQQWHKTLVSINNLYGECDEDPDLLNDLFLAYGGVPATLLGLNFATASEIQIASAQLVQNLTNASMTICDELVKHGVENAAMVKANAEDFPEEGRAACIQALGNLMMDSHAARSRLIRGGFLTTILRRFTPSRSIEELRSLAWVLQFMSGETIDQVLPAFPVILPLLHVHTDTALAQDLMCWMEAVIRDDEPYRRTRTIFSVYNGAFVGKAMEMVAHPDPRVKQTALSTLGAITSGPDEFSMLLLQTGLLQMLLPLLDSSSELRKMACWILSNVAACRDPQFSQLICRAGFIPPLMRVLREDDTNVHCDACIVVQNILSHHDISITQELVNQGIVSILRPLLDKVHKVAVAALESLRHILVTGEAIRSIHNQERIRSCLAMADNSMDKSDSDKDYHASDDDDDDGDDNEFIDVLDREGLGERIGLLCHHPSDEVSAVALNIMRKYFEDSDTDDYELEQDDSYWEEEDGERNYSCG